MDKSNNIMTIRFNTSDGLELGGQILRAKSAKATVMINPATAAKTSYYRPFAEFLVANGFNVFLWNYRGFCESRSRPLNQCTYHYSDIGQYDIPAAIDFISGQFPHLPLLVVGHSAGGQQLGFAHNCQQVSGLVALGVSAGHFASLPLPYRIKALMFFYAMVPITGAIFGYVPAERLGLMEDLPLAFAKEWSDWCAEPDMFFSPKFYGNTLPKGQFANYAFPFTVISVDDDEISTERNIANFWQHIHSNSGETFVRFKAGDVANKAVGHFGYFRKSSQIIWQEALKHLNLFIEGKDGAEGKNRAVG